MKKKEYISHYEDYDDYEDFEKRERIRLSQEENAEEEQSIEADIPENTFQRKQKSTECDLSDNDKLRTLQQDRYREQKIRQLRNQEKKQLRRQRRKNRWLILLILLLILTLGYLGARITGLTDGISLPGKGTAGQMENYTNIALFGVDSIEGSLDSGNNRTDTIMILSVHKTTGEARLVSVYRDTYLDIGDGTYTKCNAAYAYGGPQQAVEMLNRNLDLNIKDYVTVGFEGLADMIDAVGGIELTIEEDEIEHLNNYQLTMAEELGKTNTPITYAGTQRVNGLQAAAYCRIRYTAGDDFKRTQRQRSVLSRTLSALKSASLKNKLKAAVIMKQNMKTSLSASDLIGLLPMAFRAELSDTTGFPASDLIATGMIGDQSCVIPVNLARNVARLHETLFGEADYQVSETVQAASDYISSVTGYY